MRDVTEMMENLNNLPELCAVWIETEQMGGIVHKGTAGYTPAPGITSEEEVNSFNQSRDIDDATATAMEVGSMVGWDVPGANPNAWRK